MDNLIRIGFLDIGITDILDIFFVSILIYQVYKLIRGSVAFSIFIGFMSIYLLYLLLKAFGLELISGILGQFMEVGVIAMIVLFQQEIRRFLQVIGRNTGIHSNLYQNFTGIKKVFKKRSKREKTTFDTKPILEAIITMTSHKTGALMVISKNSSLRYYCETGDFIDAKLSKRLLLSIFSKNSPLHDGAVIIYKGRILAARLTLPLTQNKHIPAQFGTRHQAAIGMSENTDVLIIVVSEETGEVTLVENGEYERNMSAPDIRTRLNAYLK